MEKSEYFSVRFLQTMIAKLTLSLVIYDFCTLGQQFGGIFLKVTSKK